VNHHLGILQKWRQTVSVGARHQFIAPFAPAPPALNGLATKLFSVKKDLDAGHHHADVRHQFATLVSVRDEHRKT
jgi:hypothetical protein